MAHAFHTRIGADTQPLLIAGDSTYFHTMLIPAISEQHGAVYPQTYDTLTIDAAREIKMHDVQIDTTVESVVVPCFFEVMTTEAQHALLKLLEEARAQYVFVTPRPDTLLETLQSRLTSYTAGETADAFVTATEVRTHMQAFLSWSASARLAYIDSLLNTEEDAAPLAYKHKAFRFLNALEYYISEERQKNSEVARVLRSIWYARSYLYDTGASPRHLLEHVALSVPQRS